MASLTRIYMNRVRLKVHKMGRKRKNHQAHVGSTPTRAALFGDAPVTQETK